MNKISYDSAGTWMRARDLAKVYPVRRHSSDVFYIAVPLATLVTGILGSAVGGMAGQALGYDEDEIAASALVIGLVASVAMAILLCLPIYSNKKAYDRAMIFLKDYKKREIIPSRALYQHVSSCSNENQDSIISKLNSVQLEGVKKAVEQEQDRNPGLLSLIAKYEKDAKKVIVLEEDAIKREKKLLPDLLKLVIDNKDYNNTLRECTIVYNGRESVESKLLEKEKVITLFRKGKKSVRDKLTLFALNNDLKKMTEQISEVIVNEEINQIEGLNPKIFLQKK